MIRRYFFPLALLILFIIGFLAARFWYTLDDRRVAEDNSEVLLERIQTVAKLVTVEGYFSEIYDYKDYWYYDIPLFRKKALLRVKAKVSVGYDLERMKIDLQPDRRRIVISDLPEPEILSIDHDIDYYDITEGTFNSFSNEDYNRLNQNAKNFILAKARESDLFDAAEQQGNQILEMIRFMGENAGYEVVISDGTDFLN